MTNPDLREMLDALDSALDAVCGLADELRAAVLTPEPTDEERARALFVATGDADRVAALPPEPWNPDGVQP
jgi:hypothetical protein